MSDTWNPLYADGTTWFPEPPAETFITTGYWIDVNLYQNLADANEAAEATGRTLLISTDVTINDDYVFNIPVQIIAGGSFIKGSSGSLTFNRHIIANTNLIFDGFLSGEVIINPESGNVINPSWWGAIGDNSTDSYSAIQCAIDSVSDDTPGLVSFASNNRGMNAVTVSLAPGKYVITDEISIPTGVIFDGNNSVITQTTAAKNIIEFRWITGNGYYGTFMNGLRNITLDGGNVADIGLLLNKVNWSDFKNISVANCTTGIQLQEVQYSSFSQINSYNNSQDGIVLTYSADQQTLVCIDNTFTNVNATGNTRYGLVLHASRYNYFYKTDASRNLTADIVIGGTYWGSPAGYSVGHHTFHDTKIEHNRDDVPSSGYGIIVDGSYGNTFDNLKVSRQPAGTTYDPYFKWLYNNSYNTVINNPYDYNFATGTAGSGIWENPSVPGDYSIFRAISYNGLIVNYGSHWPIAYIAAAATDATDAIASGSSRYTFNYVTQGAFVAHDFKALGVAGASSTLFTGNVVNDVADRFQILGDGKLKWGNGTNAVDTDLYRVTGGGTLRTTGSIQVDGNVYATTSLRTILIDPPVKNTTVVIHNTNWEIAGSALKIAEITVSNTTGQVDCVVVKPTINQASGSGITSCLLINPTYTLVNSGVQYLIRAEESSASEPAWSVNRAGFVSHSVGGEVASQDSITPTGKIFHVTGTTTINTINIPYSGFNGSITIIPDGIFATGVTGNIALASTSVVSKALIMTYDHNTSKWYPSY